MKYRVGLTGGIGSGKSTVAALFEQRGVSVIDSDAISHQLTCPGGGAITAIRAAFGDGYIAADGALDRASMRRLIFGDAAAKTRLEAILHPMIRAQMADEAETATDSPYLLLVIPLLFEAGGYRELVQRALVVDCGQATQLARAMQRSGLAEQEVQAIMNGQISRLKRLRQADDVIHNDAGPDALAAEVERLHRRYLAIFTGNN
jgi:dephospho-CoA kinase